MKRTKITSLVLVVAIGLGTGACTGPDDRDDTPTSSTLFEEMVPETDELVPTTES